MNMKFLGGILLVVGTSIGAGMLALPVATAQLGLWGSMILLVGCWALMTTCAFLFLEVNLWLPADCNLISMAGRTLGKAGQCLTWVVYLVLLYSIICAYIAGGGDLFHYILSSRNLNISESNAAILFTVMFGSIVYKGIKSVDYINRGLMFAKLSALLLLIFLIMPSVSMSNLNEGEFKKMIAPSSLTITAVSFACLMIIPSLRTYFANDIKTLKRAILIGTTIPLICYIAWDMVIMGVMPLAGDNGLGRMMETSNTNSLLVSSLTKILHKDVITVITKFFTSICMATSFLSVSLSLSDFLADGFKVKKQGLFGNGLILGTTFIPPLIVVLFYPNAFLLGLQYAGISVFILMILLPPLMAWVGRYYHQLSSSTYQAPVNKLILAFFMLSAIFMLLMSGILGQLSLIIILSILAFGFILEKKNLRAEIAT